jgi:hypothetical protein
MVMQATREQEPESEPQQDAEEGAREPAQLVRGAIQEGFLGAFEAPASSEDQNIVEARI